MRTVAALYVESDGPYAGLDGVDVWDEARDARTYAGPYPVVAHPPCARWSVAANCRGTQPDRDDTTAERPKPAPQPKQGGDRGADDDWMPGDGFLGRR